eukprot:148447-Rhodomonas_salina.1
MPDRVFGVCCCLQLLGVSSRQVVHELKHAHSYCASPVSNDGFEHCREHQLGCGDAKGQHAEAVQLPFPPKAQVLPVLLGDLDVVVCEAEIDDPAACAPVKDSSAFSMQSL